MTAAGLLGGVRPAVGTAATSPHVRVPLWQTALHRGVLYGSSAATWQLSDKAYANLHARQAAVMWPEDDFLWWRLRPSPTSGIDFTYSDMLVRFAERHGQLLVVGPGLVWDQGFGEGWTDDDIWGMDRKTARRVLFGTVEKTVHRYRGRAAAWVVANEVTSPEGKGGMRTDVPWYNTIGPAYVHTAFHIAHEQDPHALLILNEFGFETVNQYGDQPLPRQKATLAVIDRLRRHGAPVHAFGIQGHLLADRFAERFDAKQYRHFLREIADRGLKILITEMDVLDDGLPANVKVRDRAVAEIYKRYLDTVLQEPAVIAVLNFGLSDRYTWLQEDMPRDDGAARRPLAFDENLKRKPAFYAIQNALGHAAHRHPWRIPPRARRHH